MDNLSNKLQTEYTDRENQARNLIVPITYHGDDTKIVIMDAESYAISNIYSVAYGRIADLINGFEKPANKKSSPREKKICSKEE